jgi:hypothetical protein
MDGHEDVEVISKIRTIRVVRQRLAAVRPGIEKYLTDAVLCSIILTELICKRVLRNEKS